MLFKFNNKFLRKIVIRKREFLAFGKLSKFRNWEIQIQLGGVEPRGISISSCIFKRLFADLVLYCEIDIGKLLWGCFVINDTRIWDKHTDKPIAYDEYEELPQKREGKPKYKSRRQGKEKWYYSSKYIKLYNLDFLNDPYGITLDFSWYPLPLFSSLQLGNHPRHKFCLGFDIGKTQVGFVTDFEICLFGYFVEFKVGQNTVARNANLFGRMKNKLDI